MPPSPPVLLVLAWDDADPAVHRVAATAALPALPTLPLVRALAAEQPTLAVLPQLPETSASEATAAPGPAVVDLGAGSHLVGLGDFTPAALAAHGAPTAAPLPAPAAPAAGAPARLANVQLRPPLAQRAAAGWQAPAAPYLGSAETAGAPAVEPAPAPTAAAPAAAAPSVAEAAAATASAPAPGAPVAPVGPPTPLAAPAAAVAPAPLFDQPEAEIGAGEAADLAEDDPDLSVETAAAPAAGPALASLTQGLAALHRAPAAAETVPPAFDLSDGLHYRVIQYARFATYVLDSDGEDFGVIYAPDWPTWLAALEIRSRTRRPLVVHLRLLAAESAAPAERGWLLELERMVLRFAHTVLVTSDALGAHARRHYPLLAAAQVRTVAADDADGVRAVLAEIGRAARP